MTLGLGIFLSVLVLIPVILFCVTRKTWNWGRTLKRIAVYGGIGAAVLALGGYAYFSWANRLQKETQLIGISLDDSKSDVLFKKGKAEQQPFGRVWRYSESEDIAHYVGFSDGAVDRVFVESVKFRKPASAYFRGTGIDSSLEEIKAVFGEPLFISQSADSMTWIVSYRKFNIAYLLFRNRCYGLILFDGSKLSGIELSDEIIRARGEIVREERERAAEEAARKAVEERRLQAEAAVAARLQAAQRAAQEAERYEAERAAAEARLRQEEERKLQLAREQQAARENLQKEQARAAEARRAETAKWKSLQLGMTAQQVEKILGRPQRILDFSFQSIWYYPPILGTYHTLSVTIDKVGGLKAYDGP